MFKLRLDGIFTLFLLSINGFFLDGGEATEIESLLDHHHNHHEYYACLPQWLKSLLDEKFFVPCYIHEDTRKNEKNVFCLDCCTSVCTHCFRRSIYKDVLRLDDIQKLIDCSRVQSYLSNGAKVIFINQRPQSRPHRVSGNTCSTCYRSLQERYFFRTHSGSSTASGNWGVDCRKWWKDLLQII
ncbi:hypothetical protein MKW92_016274 [Papaver armeniacum]|nr:hypothetical protein MKW92_016274 [Papaver armeniacum]